VRFIRGHSLETIDASVVTRTVERQRLVRALLGTLLVSAIGVNVVLSFFSDERTALFYARHAVIDPSRDVKDSWAGMAAAIDYLRAHPGQSPYASLFFEQHLKFQYPLTSLLPLVALDSLHVRRDPIAMNWISRGLNLVIASLVFLVFRHIVGASRSAVHLTVDAAMALVFTLTFFPIQMGIYSGQLQTWMTALFGMALWLWLRGSRGWSGAVIALIAAMKPHWLLFLPWALLRREWRFASALTATAAGVFLTSLAVFGPASYAGYPAMLKRMTSQGELFYANQSVNGLMHRFLTNCVGSTDFAPYSRVVFVATVVTSALLVCGALLFARAKRGASSAIGFSIVAMTVTMAAPIAWEHHYGVALCVFVAAFPIVYLGASARKRVWLAVLGISYVLISNVFPSAGCDTPPPANLLQSMTFYGGCLLLWCLYRFTAEGLEEGGARRSAAPAGEAPA